MTTRSVPRRHWRSDGTEPLPSGAEAMGEPFAAFPSWFLRIECERCGKVQMVNEAHARWRDILARMRHNGCGGLAGKAELLSGIEGVSSRPVRRIVVRKGRSPRQKITGSPFLQGGDHVPGTSRQTSGRTA
jgi:hypothetical protein